VSSDEPILRAGGREQIVAVAAGGAIGTAARYAVVALLPASAQSIPWSTLGVNLVGSFALGVLAGVLDRREGSPLVRLFLGTGVLGAFTTYSTFAVETNNLLAMRPGAGLAYLLLSVAGGLAAAAAGLKVARP
jgi:CrcB protein